MSRVKNKKLKLTELLKGQEDRIAANAIKHAAILKKSAENPKKRQLLIERELRSAPIPSKQTK